MTGVSVMQCKKALEDAKGNMEKAVEFLRKKSSELALKKGDRVLSAGVLATYLHGSTVGSMVELSCETDYVAKNEEFRQLAHDIAMHVAAMNPQYRTIADITDADKLKARELFDKEVSVLDKPTEMKEKIMEGKLSAYFAERVLTEQPFVKDSSMTIGDLVRSAIQKFGENTELTRFVRFAVGK